MWTFLLTHEDLLEEAQPLARVRLYHTTAHEPQTAANPLPAKKHLPLNSLLSVFAG